MNFHIRRGFLTAAAVVLAAASLPSAQTPDQGWPQWRGQSRDGVVRAGRAPAAWPSAWNPVWSVEVGSDVHGSQIVGLDPATGQAKWVWKGPGPGYASPLVATINNVSQLITMTNSSVVGLDARSGASLWTIPFRDEWNENIVTPLWTGSHLIVSGIRQGTHAYALSQAGTTWTAKQAWRNTDVAMYMSSPVLADGLVIGLSARRKGQFVALDAATGALTWSSSGRNADHASVLLTPTHVVYLTSGGDLQLVKRGTTAYAADRSYEVATRATYAVPLFLQGDLIVRDATHVTRMRGQ